MRKSKTPPHLRRIKEYLQGGSDEEQFYADIQSAFSQHQHEQLYQFLLDAPDPQELLYAIHSVAYRPIIIWDGQPHSLIPFSIGVKVTSLAPTTIDAQAILSTIRPTYKIPPHTLIAVDPHLYPANSPHWENPSRAYLYLQSCIESGFQSFSPLFTFSPGNPTLSLNILLACPFSEVSQVEEQLQNNINPDRLAEALKTQIGNTQFGINTLPLEFPQVPVFAWNAERLWRLQPLIANGLDRLFALTPNGRAAFPSIHSYPKMNALHVTGTLPFDGGVETLFDFDVPIHPHYDNEQTIQHILDELLPSLPIHRHNSFTECHRAAYAYPFAQ